MFDQLRAQGTQKAPEYTVISLSLHAAAIAIFIGFASARMHKVVAKEVEVAFIGPGKGKGAQPPPPPPPAGKKRSTPTPRHKTLAKIELPKLELPKIVEPVKESPPEEEEDDAEEGGVEGGVAGGVAGGVVGGVVGSSLGGTGGGGSMEPSRPERPRAKNVPAFAIARDLIRQAPPRMSEVFKSSHRGQTVNGMYKVCVDTDGSVYEVTPVKAVDGANEEIVEGIKGDWMYKPQQVPVCFLYNMVVRVEP